MLVCEYCGMDVSCVGVWGAWSDCAACQVLYKWRRDQQLEGARKRSIRTSEGVYNAKRDEYPRYCAAWVMRSTGTMTYDAIGKALGGVRRERARQLVIKYERIMAHRSKDNSEPYMKRLRAAGAIPERLGSVIDVELPPDTWPAVSAAEVAAMKRRSSV
jgi:hypothetical protein